MVERSGARDCPLLECHTPTADHNHFITAS